MRKIWYRYDDWYCREMVSISSPSGEGGEFPIACLPVPALMFPLVLLQAKAVRLPLPPRGGGRGEFPLVLLQAKAVSCEASTVVGFVQR